MGRMLGNNLASLTPMFVSKHQLVENFLRHKLMVGFNAVMSKYKYAQSRFLNVQFRLRSEWTRRMFT